MTMETSTMDSMNISRERRRTKHRSFI
jgi:hypothetical protein